MHRCRQRLGSADRSRSRFVSLRILSLGLSGRSMASANGCPFRPSFCASPDAGGSFTSLLFLPHDQAVDLLHFGPDSTVAAATVFGVGSEPRVSISLKEDSPEAPIREPRLKEETPDSEDLPSIAQRPAKRKEGDKSKEMTPNTKRKKSTEGGTAGGEKLPYVHVRARRGQATDSHSLAERARREKINARMKVLRELVPGCSKISGTTSLLDEIINHVQSLQRMIELLSMRLAAVNPRISFTGYDYFSSVDTSDGERRPTLQHIWHIDSGNPQQISSVSEKEDTYSHSLITHGNSLFQFHQFTSVPLTKGQMGSGLGISTDSPLAMMTAGAH